MTALESGGTGVADSIGYPSFPDRLPRGRSRLIETYNQLKPTVRQCDAHTVDLKKFLYHSNTQMTAKGARPRGECSTIG